MDLELKDKVAIVTGGSRGIGRAAAAALLAEGAQVVVSSVQPDSMSRGRRPDRHGPDADLGLTIGLDAGAPVVRTPLVGRSNAGAAPCGPGR